ncbi:uncharacterized protein KIAA1958 homolog [Strix uralensis]|uniref:uncharacterized protein KIAA1958 homolog n=1 Tax=Strix uralensis TaxID=36305 RepID=UPI003DA7668D
MNKSVRDGRCGDAGSLYRDLSRLVTWAHSHGTICDQIPALETAQNVGHPSKDNSVLWMCALGHAYCWQCEEIYGRGREENEAVEKRKRLVSSEASSGEANLDEKRFRMTPSFGRAKADAVSRGSCSSSPGVPQQKDNTICVIDNEPPPGLSRKNSKSMKSGFAAEQHLSSSGDEVKTDRHKVKLESDRDLQILSNEEQCISDEDNQGARINQSILSESQNKGVTAEVDLQMHRSQKTALPKPAAAQAAASSPPGRPPLPLACALQAPASPQESLHSSFLGLGPLNPAGAMPEASSARNSSGSPMPKEHLKSSPVSNTEAKAQPESPSSVTFFELEATVSVQHQLQQSPPEHRTPGAGFGGSVGEDSVEEGEPSGSGHTPHPAASLSPDRPPASSHKNVLKKGEKKRNRNTGDIKVFKDWLVLHYPSEICEIYELPPQDLDNYLASFYSCAKRQNGADFSASSLHLFQSNIERYLKDHNYGYSVVKGLEFRAAQEAFKLKHQHLSQQQREGKWSVVENLTDEDVEGLRKKGFVSRMHPQGFLHLMFTTIIRAFGASTHSQGNALYWGQLVLKKQEGELEYLAWKDGLSAEVDPGEAGLRLFAKPDDPGTCPVTDYKEYARRRPPDMLHDHDPLYLAPKALCSMWDQVWYSRKSLAKARIEKILRVIVQQVKGSVKKSKK